MDGQFLDGNERQSELVHSSTVVVQDHERFGQNILVLRKQHAIDLSLLCHDNK